MGAFKRNRRLQLTRRLMSLDNVTYLLHDLFTQSVGQIGGTLGQAKSSMACSIKRGREIEERWREKERAVKEQSRRCLALAARRPERRGSRSLKASSSLGCLFLLSVAVDPAQALNLLATGTQQRPFSLVTPLHRHKPTRVPVPNSTDHWVTLIHLASLVSF